MQRFIFIFCLFMIGCMKGNASLFAPLLEGVNVITGLSEEQTEAEVKKYQPGINQTIDGSVDLADDDFRIGKISRVTLDGSDPIYFSYEPSSTSVYSPDHVTKYGYSPNELIETIEYYEKGTLNRREKLNWNENSQLTGIILENGSGEPVKSTHFHYDEKGVFIQKEEKIEGSLNLCYDNKNRLEKASRANANSSYEYDEAGNILFEKHQIASREYTIQREYDSHNRLLSVTEGKNKNTRYRYDNNGKILQVIKPDGVAIDYVYNEQGLLEEFKASDGSFRYLYKYNQKGLPEKILDMTHRKKQTRSYNERNELTKEVQNTGVKIGYVFDGDGRQKGLILPDRSKIVYHYQEGLLTSIDRVDSDHSVQYSHQMEYNEQGQIKAHHVLKELGKIELKYDEKGYPASISSPWWSQEIEKRDDQGRITHMAFEQENGVRSVVFAYTEEGQLAEEEEDHYTYDLLYNRVGKNGSEWKINSLNQLVQTPDASYVYDINGNLIAKHSKEGKILFAYDALDRMVKVENPEKQRVQYIYDSFHRRIEQRLDEWQEGEWKHQGTEKFIYDGFKEIGKIDQEGNLVELRILDNSLTSDTGSAVALELYGKLLVPIHDLQGSVSCLVDAESGEIIENYSYSAFGEECIKSSFVRNPWRYCSKRVNESTGLVFFGKREYDPQMGRWISPDPLLFCDTPNLYAFARNDPLNCTDQYGLFSISKLWDNLSTLFFKGFQYLQFCAHHAKIKLSSELKLPPQVSDALEKIGKTLLGESTYLLMGPYYEETQIGNFGEREISDKVRVTFINGILNTRMVLHENLSMISDCHGGVKIHYVFRPTEGWTWDVSRGIMIRMAYFAGFRSIHAHLLAKLWSVLIEEMGGVDGGGTIVHYAHSLGGSETDRARQLLTPEEQKMIRVITFGSSTLIRNEGFQFVVNHVSVNDGVSSIFLEPLGRIRNYFDPDSNVRYYASDLGSRWLPIDHLLNGPTYGPLLRQMGTNFVHEFSTED